MIIGQIIGGGKLGTRFADAGRHPASHPGKFRRRQIVAPSTRRRGRGQQRDHRADVVRCRSGALGLSKADRLKLRDVGQGEFYAFGRALGQPGVVHFRSDPHYSSAPRQASSSHGTGAIAGDSRSAGQVCRPAA